MPKANGKKGKKKKDIDWTAPDIFDKNRSLIYIEHTYECPIFQKKADEFLVFLQNQIPERMFVLVRNRNGKVHPRPGAFEIDFCQHARTSLHNLWSGIDKGPPRRDKFPGNYQMLIPEVQKVLRKFYPDEVPVVQLDDDYDPGF